MNKSPKHIRLLKMEIPETGTSSVVKEHHLPAANMHAPCSPVCSAQPSLLQSPRPLGAIREHPEHPCCCQDRISVPWLPCQPSQQQHPEAAGAGLAVCSRNSADLVGISRLLLVLARLPCGWVGAGSTWCPEPSAGTRQGGTRSCPWVPLCPGSTGGAREAGGCSPLAGILSSINLSFCWASPLTLALFSALLGWGPREHREHLPQGFPVNPKHPKCSVTCPMPPQCPA